MKYYAILGGVIAALATVESSSAAPFSADGATASSEFSSSYVAENTINGSGLTATGNPALSHDIYRRGNHWTTASGNPTDAWISWSFNAPVSLGGIYIWNHQSTSPGLANNDGYEPTLFDLTFLDATNSVLATFDDVALAPDSDASQAFTLSSVLTGVASVLFEVEAVQNTQTPFTGLAEVLFDDSTIGGATRLGGTTTVVPLPAAGFLLLGGLGFLAGASRLRRR